MRVLITGVTGFVGGHLAELFLSRPAVELHGLARRGVWPTNLAHLANQVVLHADDLTDRGRLAALLARVRPDWIAHLAGYANTGRSFREPDAAWSGNLDTTRTLYAAIHQWGGSPRVLYVSTGLIYGEADCCDETAPLRPTSPYAASKAAADLASYQVARTSGLDIVIARPFNHLGPRQSPDYAVARFASQLAAIERGAQSPQLETGNLDSTRDLTDVRDVVRAYVRLLEQGRRGEPYNVGSGTPRRMADVLAQLLACSSAVVEVRSRTDGRLSDRAAFANVDKLHQETGWRPEFPLEQTLQDTLDYWRQVGAATTSEENSRS